jgi:hypothetical protein
MSVRVGASNHLCIEEDESMHVKSAVFEMGATEAEELKSFRFMLMEVCAEAQRKNDGSYCCFGIAFGDKSNTNAYHIHFLLSQQNTDGIGLYNDLYFTTEYG